MSNSLRGGPLGAHPPSILPGRVAPYCPEGKQGWGLGNRGGRANDPFLPKTTRQERSQQVSRLQEVNASSGGEAWRRVASPSRNMKTGL